MSDTNPNTPTPTVDELTTRLTAIRSGIAKGLGLAEDATDEALLARAAEVAKERDEAKTRADTIAAERNAERMDAEIRHALGKAGISAQNTDDAATILRGVLEVTDKGVVTKAAPNVVPGQTPEQFIAGQLRTLRPHYWPLSIGAGAKGAGHAPHAGADASCFREGGTLTAQMALVARVGERAAIEACRRSGIVPPAWLTGGAR
ncbi:MAG: hypothetical protein EDM82_05860 [Cyanobacteria bacterium CYA]|nr:MAG: hypothetical protein EDM82_05860 [Cyanobacteria bacterium CYA]